MKLKINILSFVAVALLALAACNSDPKPTNATTTPAPGSTTGSAPAPTTVPEPVFTKEGELAMTDPSGKKVLLKIDIEIAGGEQERQEGLMYRKSMSDKQGMLFLFDFPEEQSFWMHNTYIPLDIIYISDKLEIVSIQKNAKPQNDQPLPSDKPAQYVLDINGGLSDKLGLKPGCKAAWSDWVNTREMGGYNALQ